MCPGPPKPNASLKPAFDILDSDHDGKISLNDLQTFYRSYTNSSGITYEQDIIDSMISMADLNKNGFVEYDEFERVVLSNKVGRKTEGGKGLGYEVVDEMFKMMDGDKNGKVGHEDLKRWFGKMDMVVSDEEVEEMVRMGGGGDDGVGVDGFKRILGFVEGGGDDEEKVNVMGFVV